MQASITTSELYDRPDGAFRTLMRFIDTSSDKREFTQVVKGEPLLRTAHKYLKDYAKFFGTCQRVPRFLKPVEEAFLIYKQPLSAMTVRSCMEAYLLTKASKRWISDTVMLEYGEDTVKMYERLFFHVDPYKHNKIRVMDNVINPRIATESNTDDMDSLIKLAAVEKGHIELYDFLKSYAGSGLTAAQDKWLKGVARANMLKRSASATMSSKKINSFEGSQIMEKQISIWKIQEPKAPETEGSLIDVAYRSVLEAMRQEVADPTVEDRIADKKTRVIKQDIVKDDKYYDSLEERMVKIK